MGFFLTDWIKHPSHIPVVGSIFGTTPEQDQLKKQIANLQGLYAQYRPQAATAQMAGLNQRLDAFAPVNNLIGQVQGMGPGQAYFNLDSLRKNPLNAPGAPLAQAAATQELGPDLPLYGKHA